MNKEDGIKWIKNKLARKAVQIPFKIELGEYHPEPITVYNRTIDDYGRILRSCGYGVRWNSHDSKSEKLVSSRIIPFVGINELNTAHLELLNRDRELLMSFAL